jgi:uncharacterized protein YuzE
MTKVKIEYDPGRDLLYLWFSTPGEKAADTVTVAPGLHVDFDAAGKLIGIEVLDASEILGDKVQFEVDSGLTSLPPAGEPATTAWEELTRLGKEIGQGWHSPLTSAELLSEMR